MVAVMKELEEAEKVYETQLHALALVTMWPTTTGTKIHQMFKILHWVNAVVLAVCSVGLLAKAVNTKDLVDRSEAMDILTLTASALYKMVFFYVNHDELLEILYLGYELIKHLPKKWNRLCKGLTLLHCTLGFAAISLWGLCPIFKWSFGETEIGEMTLPMNVVDPFNSTGVLFVFFYIVCHYGLVLATQIYMAADCYLFTSVHVANGSFEVVRRTLESMKYLKEEEESVRSEKIQQMLKDCVKLHSRTKVFLRKIDRLFRSLIVVDVVHAIISLSFAMLQASESKGIFETLKMIVFVAYCFVHQYLNSFFGQHLIDQQEALHTQMLVSVPWDEGTLATKKSYLIIINGTMRSKKLSAWSVYTLQYATFLEFVKSMISYFMVLRQLKDNTEV